MTSQAKLRVLALAGYPSSAAVTRYRLSQLQPPLAERGIQLEVRPFLDEEGMVHLYGPGTAGKVAAVGRGLARRARDLYEWRHFDVVVVQREAMLVGPPVVEWLLNVIGSRPLVLDIDDPIWLPEQSLVPSALSKLRRWPGKTSWLLAHATLVTCGNRFLASHVGSLGHNARVVSNGIDVSRIRPSTEHAHTDRLPKVGWVGTHTTYPYLEAIFPSLEAVERRERFTLRIVGSGQYVGSWAGTPAEFAPFELAREAEDFSSLDIGLYPLPDDPWTRGKSGLKALQYLAAGVPYIASPVGVVGEIGIPGTTHLEATTPEEWQLALGALLADPDLRARMGASARQYAESNYTLEHATAAMADALRESAG